MTEENAHSLRVALYERVSARRQVEESYSLGGSSMSCPSAWKR